MLQELIGSQSRSRILEKLFRPEADSFYLRKLARECGFSAPVIHRELKHLTGLGLVLQNSDGNRINFAANAAHPLYPVLCELVRLTADPELT